MPLIGRHPPLIARVTILAVAAAAAFLPQSAVASPEEDLAAAQRRANRVAGELAEAQAELARAEDAVTNTQTRVARIDSRVSAVRDRVRELAVRMYVGGTRQLTRLLRMEDANQMVLAQQFSHVIAGVSTDALRQYRADRQVLREELEVLEQRKENQAEALGTLRQRRTEAVTEINRLASVVEQARAAQEAERAAQARSVTSARSSSGTAGPTARPGSEPAGSEPAAASPGAPATTAAPSARPTVPAPSVATGEWVCPVQGPHAFSDDYGDSRGGGYSHMGNDILAPKGTPVVANVSGVVTHRNGAVSGLAYFLAGDDGNRYFGAHLDSFGESGYVSAGTVIGTVGNTGDASGGPPHLHFEIHPGGSGYTNPYPTLTKYC